MSDLNYVSDLNARVISEFRSNGGVVGGRLEGIPLLLLTHRGTQTGTSRTTPLGYTEHGSELLVVASAMGASSDPAWYRNVAANPDVSIELGTERFAARARVLEGEEHAARWEEVIAMKPFLVEHQERARRQIPLVALVRER